LAALVAIGSALRSPNAPPRDSNHPPAGIE
jgi:hypothetical protein